MEKWLHLLQTAQDLLIDLFIALTVLLVIIACSLPKGGEWGFEINLGSNNSEILPPELLCVESTGDKRHPTSPAGHCAQSAPRQPCPGTAIHLHTHENEGDHSWNPWKTFPALERLLSLLSPINSHWQAQNWQKNDPGPKNEVCAQH